MAFFFGLILWFHSWHGAIAQTPPAVALDVAPLAPADPGTPYASPRDAARRRLQKTLEDLESKRDVTAAIRGFADALATDATYPVAAFDLAVVCAIAEKWDDAVAAFEYAARLDPSGYGKQAAPQLERLRIISSLDKTAEGKLQRRYDEALLPLVNQLPGMPEGDAAAALAQLGRIDPKRWEAPALLAALHGNGRGYDVAARFLEIAASNAADPAIKSSLERALRAAERELRYAAARAAAEAAADSGDHQKAAELFEEAWNAAPARAFNGMEAASSLMLQDDTARAEALLGRLAGSGDPALAQSAREMRRQLEAIEPAAKLPAPDSSAFYRDPGPPEPVRIADLIPPVDRSRMETLHRPLPRIAQDPEPVVLLASLAADVNPGSPAVPPPALAEPAIAGSSPWREVQSAWASASAAPRRPEPKLEHAVLEGEARANRTLHVASEPAGAGVLIGDRREPLCSTPCDVQAGGGVYTVRLHLDGYQDEEREARVGPAGAEVIAQLAAVRGSVIVETSAAAAIQVNGTPMPAQPPVEILLLPGLHRIAADFNGVTRERLITIKPGAQLRVLLQP